MRKKKIAITGAKGTIGSVLIKNLRGYQITPLDLPEVDVRNYLRLEEKFKNQDVVIHLAHDTRAESWKSGKINLNNILMTYNVYEASVESQVSRVIMASSVHADSYLAWKGKALLVPERTPIPDSLYGATKIFMESLGRYYAKYRGLEVVCIRFGGVNPEDRPDLKEKDYKKIWLSHSDCTNLIKTCIESKKIPNNFVIIYGVSNNTHRIHDWTNPLGWIPKDNSERW